jgi:3-methyladenine DNA glycosylase AlkC
MTDEGSGAAPALKEIFNAGRMRHIATELALVRPDVDGERFLAGTLDGLDALSIMQRLRRVAEALRAALPDDYLEGLAVLRALAPRLNHGFVTMALPEYVALYGLDDFDASMEALKDFTVFGSSEFAVRPFLKRDLDRTLAVMAGWAHDPNEHVRRLASEGSRPRLPWSFRLEPLTADPSRLAPILEALKADPSLYVRRSVANSLNDITKDNPGWALDRIEGWDLGDARTAWIAKHALRSLIKRGDRRALAVVGAAGRAEVALHDLRVQPARIRLGDRIALSFRLESRAASPQRLVVDYAVHYVKKNGASSAKVFKLKALTLAPHATETFRREQAIRDFTTRVHYPGRHAVEVMVNGEVMGRTAFELEP